jgi:hypothetical protein
VQILLLVVLAPKLSKPSNPADGTAMDLKKLVALQKTKYLREYYLKQFTATGTQLTVIDVIDQFQHFLRMGVGYGLTKSDRLIYVIIRFVSAKIYE